MKRADIGGPTLAVRKASAPLVRRSNSQLKITIRLAAALLIIAPATVAAHPGGLNAEGCHTNRKTGDRHCHRARRGGEGEGSAPRTLRGPSSGGAYVNCTAARAAGAAPVRRGDPGYGPHLDRDGDGVGCE